MPYSSYDLYPKTLTDTSVERTCFRNTELEVKLYVCPWEVGAGVENKSLFIAQIPLTQ